MRTEKIKASYILWLTEISCCKNFPVGLIIALVANSKSFFKKFVTGELILGNKFDELHFGKA